MIRGVAITLRRRPSVTFMREWQAVMAAKKAADPTFAVVPLPHWLEVVDAAGRPTPAFAQLAGPLGSPLKTERLVDGQGRPTEYALGWWKEVS
jgi:hypothetical protein